ncbi:2Fe-2S iron-sulfur cluster-binding protein [Brevibacillus sp. H7]|jgi:ferredoxin|uniref:2Fe-2S iron-sulfur cluster-binding protein n=1 Tax=Brevibacillus sp. H7 TaxID=3349138 RepID=UPI0037F22FDC
MEQSVGIEVTVVRGGKREQVTLRHGENLLMALVQAGLPIEFFCTTGKCATCRLQMTIPDGSAAPASETERYRLGETAIGDGFRLSCQVYVTGPLTVYLPES